MDNTENMDNIEGSETISIQKLDAILNNEHSEQKKAAEEALLEYVESLQMIDFNKAEELKLKLNDEKYKNLFSLSIMQMSFLISGALVLKEEVEFLKIQKKILCDSRDDDDELFEMRNFYLEKITAEELNEILTTKSEQKRFTLRMKNFKDSYLLTTD